MLSSIVKPTSHPFLEGVCEIKNQSQRRQLHFRNFVQKFKKENFMSTFFKTHLEHLHFKFKWKHCSKKLQNLDGFTGPYFQSKSDNVGKVRNNLTRLIFSSSRTEIFSCQMQADVTKFVLRKFFTVRENIPFKFTSQEWILEKYISFRPKVPWIICDSLFKKFQIHSDSGSV